MTDRRGGQPPLVADTGNAQAQRPVRGDGVQAPALFRGMRNIGCAPRGHASQREGLAGGTAAPQRALGLPHERRFFLMPCLWLRPVLLLPHGLCPCSCRASSATAREAAVALAPPCPCQRPPRSGADRRATGEFTHRSPKKGRRPDLVLCKIHANGIRVGTSPWCWAGAANPHAVGPGRVEALLHLRREGAELEHDVAGVLVPYVAGVVCAIYSAGGDDHLSGTQFGGGPSEGVRRSSRRSMAPACK